MLDGRLAISVVLAYAAALLALALWGDRTRGHGESAARRKAVYVLSSCVYCSAWSFCGSIEMASRGGIDFLPLELGPILAFALGRPILARIIRLAKTQKITSVADFVGARYGKATSVAALVTIIVTLASIPFVALQIRAIATALAIFIDGSLPAPGTMGTTIGVTALFVTLALAVLTIVVGTRHLDATEHQRGLVLIVAVESAIKLVAFVAVGIFVCWGMFNGVGALTETVASHPNIGAIIDKPPDPALWLSLIVASTMTAVLLPRQFHVSIVENREEADLRTATWFVPLYLVASSLFVLPIAVAGLAMFGPGAINRDFTILALPVQAHAPLVALIALLGTVSAAASMIMVTAMTLAVMVSNDLVVPFLLKLKAHPLFHGGTVGTMPILAIRRIAILAILGLALAVSLIGKSLGLSTVGLLSLAGIAQIAPAAVGGLVWRRATARGAIGGTLAGTLVVAYTLVLPMFVPHSSAIVTQGPLGLDALRPTDLLGLDLAPFAQALIWSLSINVLVYVGLSLSRPATINERLQANVFVNAQSMSLATSFRLRHSTITVGELLAGVARYLRPASAQRLFIDWHAARDLTFDRSGEADASLILYAENLIATSIGVGSSRVVMSLLLQKREMSEADARQIVDDAAFELQDTRDLLQHAIDVARDGMAVFDADLLLVAWNRAYREMFQLPQNLMRVGVPLDVLVRSNAERGVYGRGPVDAFVGARLETLTRPNDGHRLHSAPYGRVLEMRSVRLRNGGLFFTYTDATKQVTSEEELEAENLTLERRVRERTDELEHLNVELLRAKAEAEDANISKSRFLAAASHDLLQPLSAARIYATSLRDRLRTLAPNEPTTLLASNVDESLEAVEDILGALLEISRIDAGAVQTEITTFGVGEMLRLLQLEFEPAARARGLSLRIMPTSLRITSDRRLLRRMIQNLVSNAIKYTMEGRVVVGARRIGARVRIDVYDTGIGIPASKQKIVFREFERLAGASEAGPGAGLGLSIVERLGEVLDHEVRLRSAEGRGSVFSVTVPRATAAAVATAVAIGNASRPRSLEHLTVAAIDNETHVLSAITMLLQGWDCVVGSGTGLAEVERSFDEMRREPDVIVADYHIGDVDGLAVIAALRARYGYKPAVLVTADRNPAIRDLAHAADVRVLHKPLKPAALRALLSQWHLVKAAAE